MGARCSPVARSQGGGYLARQHIQAAAPAPVAKQRAGAHPASSSARQEAEAEAEAGFDEAGSDDDDPADFGRAPPCPSLAQAADPLTLTVHIAYHPSYRVPVLYFEAAGRDGAPLALEAALDALPLLRLAVRGSAQPHSVVTQEVRRGQRKLHFAWALKPGPISAAAPAVQDHPVLQRPFCMVHPCQTEALMKLMLPPSQSAAPEGSAGQQEQQEQQQHAAQLLRYMLGWLSVAGQPLGVVPPAVLLVDAAAAAAHAATASSADTLPG